MAFFPRFIFVLFSVIFLMPSAFADEGMWVFNNLPTQYLKSRYNFEPTEQWVDHVMKSSVRFNVGGSGSFVSSTGLVLTNHHVGADTLQKISNAQHNYYEEGFYASDYSQEVKAPDLELNQLISIQDVTDRVNAAATPGMDVAQGYAAKRAMMADIEKESFQQTGLRSDVVTLYNGGQYQLYRYKKYTDVRLVFAPEFKIAFFGGDPDNFEYPRFDLDICLFRVYENGQPARIDNYFEWSEKGTKEGDLVFVSGNPGSTNRMYTMAALKFVRDRRLPLTLEHLYREEIALQQFMNRGVEEARRGQEDFFSIQNSRKANVGRLQGLQDQQALDTKQKEEDQLRSRVASDVELKKFAGAWTQIESAQKVYRKIYMKYVLLEKAWGFNSRLFQIARTLVRMAREDQISNSERLSEYRDSGRASLEQGLFSEAPIYSDLEQAELQDSLSYFVEKFGGNNPLVERVLAGKNVVDRAAQLVSDSKLYDVSVRKALAAKGQSGIEQSSDPMIILAQMIDPASRAFRKTYEDQVDGVSQSAYGQISQAKFALNGTSDYPDATFTLRLAFGEVKGYHQNGADIAPVTTVGGAFQHEAEHGARDPYLLPASWHQHKKDLDLTTPFNFVSTADIIGGNSGSPVIDRAGAFVGIIFDGNIQSLPLQFVYSDTQARAVSVNSNAIIEAMRKIYGAGKLASELGH